MSREINIEDILALVEGRLDRSQAEELAAQAGDDLAGLEQAVEGLEAMIERARRAFPDPADLARELEQWSENPAELVLEQDQMPERLPSTLARAIAARKQGSLGERIKRSVEALTSLSGRAARDLADRISAGAAPAAAPAIRKDATQVDDQDDDREDVSQDDQKRD